MQVIGLEVPSRSLGAVHLALAAGVTALAILRPRPWLRNLILGIALTTALGLPILWVGPLWGENPEHSRFVWGFYLTFVLSLSIPLGAAILALAFLARRPSRPGLGAGAVLPLLAYVGGLIASYSITFNYALLYPLIR